MAYELLKGFQFGIRHVFHLDNLLMHDRESCLIYQGFTFTFEKRTEFAFTTLVGLSDLVQGRSEAIKGLILRSIMACSTASLFKNGLSTFACSRTRDRERKNSCQADYEKYQGNLFQFLSPSRFLCRSLLTADKYVETHFLRLLSKKVSYVKPTPAF